MTVNERYLLASYEVSYCIVENKMPLTIGEDLVLPAATTIVKILYGRKHGDNF